MREDKLREKNKTIRLLKAQVRQLRKRLNEAESEVALIYSLWDRDVVDQAKQERRTKIERKKLPLCPQCGNDTLTVSIIGVWKMERCSGCEYFNREKHER